MGYLFFGRFYDHRDLKVFSEVGVSERRGMSTGLNSVSSNSRPPGTSFGDGASADVVKADGAFLDQGVSCSTDSRPYKQRPQIPGGTPGDRRVTTETEIGTMLPQAKGR